MIYLASTSPRRVELLTSIGVEFSPVEVNINESWDGREEAGAYVCRLALEKARLGREKTAHRSAVLAADTEVIIDDEILGKPENRQAAMNMLEKLSGRTHQVLTAVVLIDTDESLVLNSNLVTFRRLTTDECRRYCKVNDTRDKAGAYAIQGPAAAFITGLHGSYSGVMGLPLRETRELLASQGSMGSQINGVRPH